MKYLEVTIKIDLPAPRSWAGEEITSDYITPGMIIDEVSNDGFEVAGIEIVEGDES